MVLTLNVVQPLDTLPSEDMVLSACGFSAGGISLRRLSLPLEDIKLIEGQVIKLHLYHIRIIITLIDKLIQGKHVCKMFYNSELATIVWIL